MEDFIDNEILDTQDDAIQDGNTEYGYDSYVNQQQQEGIGCGGYSDTYEIDRNGDGIVDGVVVEEDTDGDGYVDHVTVYYDDDQDGYVDGMEEQFDTNGDGYLETTMAQYDTNGDGQFDTIVAMMDVNGNGQPDVVEVAIDTNHDGNFDSHAYQADSNGDGMVDYARRETDYDGDGQADSVREYIDSDHDGTMDMVAEYYDSNHDGQMDRVDVHFDYDGDGKTDYTMVCAYNPVTGEVTPLDDAPSYAGAIEGTYSYELEQYEPQPDYPAGIVGDPQASMEQWEYQGNTGRCALYSQKFIIEEFTGQEIDIEEFADMAEQNGWFSEDFGTTFLNMNKMLDAYGIDNEMSFHNDVSDIEECLNNGGRVIVAIDADEIWYGEGDDMFSPNSQANHAVEVIGIDYSDPENPMVILNDSGNPNGRGEMVPLDDFMDAWNDSECQMIACYPER